MVLYRKDGGALQFQMLTEAEMAGLLGNSAVQIMDAFVYMLYDR